MNQPATENSIAELERLLVDLFPLHRSLTGPGVRATIARLAEWLPLTVTEVPTGTEVFDWTIPREWRIRAAYVADETGQRVIDYANSNLHVVGYSTPVCGRLSWSELDAHLHSDPAHPTAIPYRTSYFGDAWGFCLPHDTRQRLAGEPERQYDVVIDSELVDGSLTYAEFLLPGDEPDEFLISAHVCHPSLANDNLSGVAVAALVGRQLARRPRRRWTYRILFAPATLGAIAWLAQHQELLPRIRHGLVLSLLGDNAPLCYKRSRQGDAPIDELAEQLLRELGHPERMLDFTPIGYDERQFGSPGIDLPMGCLMRNRPGMFPEYHTSLDNLQLIRPEHLLDAAEQVVRLCDWSEANRYYRNLRPFGEPMLGRHGLYRAFGEQDQRGRLQEAVLWVLNQADTSHSLLDISRRSGLPFAELVRAAAILCDCGLLAPVSPPNQPPPNNHSP